MPGKNRSPYIARGNQRTLVARTITVFNVDNGAGTTADDASIGPYPFDAYLINVRAVYTEATDTAGAASANFKLGVTSGGSTLVAVTALEVSKAIGSYTEGTILVDLLPANTALWVRHTGVATTEAGQYFVQVQILPKP